MVRNIVVLGGSSHPSLVETICEMLGISPGQALFSKFAVGETRVEIYESVRGKDVYIIQSGGGKVNDHFVELCIAIAACKTASAKKVTVVLPLFPYSRQSDIPYNKSGGRCTVLKKSKTPNLNQRLSSKLQASTTKPTRMANTTPSTVFPQPRNQTSTRAPELPMAILSTRRCPEHSSTI